MTDQALDNFINALREYQLTSVIDRAKGCNSRELDELMRAQKVTYLPTTYMAFMRKFGKSGVSPLFAGSTLYEYPHVGTNKEDARLTLIDHESELELPGDAYVFSMDDVSTFHFFHTSNMDDNPEIFEWRASNRQIFRKPNQKYTEFLVCAVSHYDSLRSRYPWLKDRE